ncbi:hypothetical protein LT330_006049 [Penicillium expansum]|nr:hypothetical protein LT330_006049 [Penicillium expansum]
MTTPLSRVAGRLSICRSPAACAFQTRGTPDLRSLLRNQTSLYHPDLGAKRSTQRPAWGQQVSLPRCAQKNPYPDAQATYHHHTILIPAAIALSIYIIASCVIIPFFRRYHQRYSQYLPLHSISAHTLSLRDRIADKLMHFFLPSQWRWGAHIADHDTESIDDEEGEILVGMDMDSVRRGALEQRRRDDLADTQSRLSRDLEEGFMDDSDEEGSERSRSGRGERL